MDSLRRRLRAAAGPPGAQRTTPGQLRALVRRHQRRRRMAALAAGVVLVTGLGSGAALLARSQTTQRIEFADAPSPTRDGAVSERTTSEPAVSEGGQILSASPSTVPSEREPARNERESVTASSPPRTERPDAPPGVCNQAPDGFRVPKDADIRGIGDVDGDGNPDGLWIDSTRTLGIVTAAGGSATYTVDSAAPSAVSAMAVDADQKPPLELLVSDGRTVHLLVFDDCEIAPVINTRDGRPWLFDLGFRGTGTGVGCLDVFGRRKLAGLIRQSRDGDWVSYEAAVLELDGRTVTVSETVESRHESPAEDAAIERLSQVTCGTRTMANDGVTTPIP